jgi:hypothetical protein
MKNLAARLQYNGGDQLGRINQQKLNSLHWALRNSYNSRKIKTPNGSVFSCLIKTNNLKADYDKEYISVDFKSGLQQGDTFEVLDNGTHWMIYLPVFAEKAYLRAEIIKCNYTLDIDDSTYWIYLQGATETDISWQKNNSIAFNELNISGTIYIKKDSKTTNYFHRFSKIKIDGHVYEIQVVDELTVPGIIELEIQEYYDNTIAELPEIIKQEDNDSIIGKTIVLQDSTIGYTIKPEYYKPELEWKVADNPRVKIDSIADGGRMCRVRVYPGAIGSYKIYYGEHELEATIQWEKPVIKGPQLVFPYDIHTYFLKDNTGTFSLDTKLARINSFTDNSCEVEIISGKKGEFTLYCETEEEKYELPIIIKSM